MSNSIRLVVRSSGMSKPVLADLLGGICARDKRVKVANAVPGSALNADPATVALIAAAGLTVAELIKSVTAVYLERLRAAQETPRATVVVRLAMGGSVSASVGDEQEIDQAIAGFPTDDAEIAELQLL